ncbi:MAG TPA: aldehyde ferredoxin oxidoreductase C-terminal domain-containing protein [Negativicutes bacterium]|nr:aldehyde ferredoxin oxidoreductase C-terminal domain-containing protein [Negativicutes bacterium]
MGLPDARFKDGTNLINWVKIIKSEKELECMRKAARILEVNLSDRKTEIRTIPGETYRLYPGGSALGVYLLLQEMKPGIDPLGPENMLVFSVSALTALPISGISRLTITAKSPLTGTIGDSQSGENLVRFACIINMCNRANGRNGMGAAMGSKNLKAVVVKKAKASDAHDKDRFRLLATSVKKRLEDNQTVSGLGKYGIDGDLEGFHNEGFLPTRNWISGYFPQGAAKTTGTTMYETILKDRDTCFGCAVRCKRVVEVPGMVDPRYGGPEYETCATFGSYCGITELPAVALANQLCIMYGLDTISCGATIAFAMECHEKGLLGNDDTFGLELKFGNDKVMIAVVEMIAKREGIGELLAEGSLRAAQKIGRGAEALSMSVKGQELPAHMPQFKPSVGLVYAVNPFGADHQSSEHDVFLVLPPDSRERQRLGQLGIWKGYDNPFVLDNEKVRFALESQKYFSVLDTLCLCQFVWGPAWELFGLDDLAELCRSGIGWDTPLHELLLIGERRINMMRYFNSCEGFGKKDDKLPGRLFEPFKDGPSEGVCLNREAFEAALGTYYEMTGWDKETGNPTDACLKRLSLDWLFGEYEVYRLKEKDMVKIVRILGGG